MSRVITHQKAAAGRWQSTAMAVGVILFLLLLTLALYTLLHEGGHALMALLFGGKITGISLNFLNLSAHVSFSGDFSTFQNGVIGAAGVLLPVLACMAFILLSPRKTDRVLAWFKVAFFACAVNALLAWVAIPLLTMQGQRISDDSANFLRITGAAPWLVTGVALLVYLACWFLAVRKMGGFRAIAGLFRGPGLDLDDPAAQKSLVGLLILGVVVAAAVIILPRALPDRTFDVPAGYTSIAEIQLSAKTYNDEAIYQFTLDQPASVSFYFDLYQIKGGPDAIHLVGPGGYDNLFFNILDPQADLGQASVHPQNIQLEKGDYQVKITFPASQGRVRAYIKK